MLQELSIKNFAIIDQISVSFEKGLTVLTGETGAGKSIIIDALHLLVGGRGSVEFVRHGENKADIEGLFFLENNHPCFKKAAEFGIDIEEGMIILRREISSSGKSVCRVNGKLVTISTLREIGSTLIDIHGQHEHQELMDESTHLSLLDQYGFEKIRPALESYREIYRQYDSTLKKIKELKLNEQEMAHRLDLLQFQLQEIRQADLKINEDEVLLEERRQLANFEKIFAAIKAGYEGLQGEQHGLDYISHTMSHLETAADLDKQYENVLESVANSYYLLEDAADKLRGELDRLEFDPERLNAIEGRINEINQLKRKYGSSVSEILEYCSKIEEEIEMLENRDARVGDLESKLSSLGEDLSLEGKQLTDIRKKWAEKLTVAIHQELKELYMDKTVFEPVFIKDSESNSEFGKDGLDDVVFYISTNPGEPLKPLSKVASGGELSRMMLALKTIFSKHQGITSIIFDEVDTGVSGRVAQAIAEKIHQVSKHSQVLCISHLPQVAAMADTHLLISKEAISGRTRTTLTKLGKNEKISEIARMISGVEITDITKKHAKELLDIAYTIKLT
ncbi:DNA repair protein RecN [Lederbergia wuyishanensis]|uniref:DNA repair protein RecN n=1 Tax=Lederbergia wuyishanensis TaxID=1347903 RepID=A0ABU0D1A3_9BACI|nr:DNA repair protein RecN [Lederbergia wuyishanensis]MCJ8006780.1 DNA repair protein RecN [Lederbergia wuyishanensis]MDQ0342162.1 DNA repair protein RecN (Recombination protein N) [Lederbergia wuyishanensis]